MNALAKPDGTESDATALLRTLALCDLADSTALVERLGDQRAAELIRKHDRLARALVHLHGGREIDKTDGFLLMFDRPIQAVAFALDYQRSLKQLNAAEKAGLTARVGIHVGDVLVWDNSREDIAKGAKPIEVEGLVKPVASRLMSLALPGQILLSGVAYQLAHRAQGELGEQLAQVRWRTHGRYRFKGIPDPVPVFEVGEEGLAPLKPPPWSSKAHREVPIWRRPATVVFELVAITLAVGIGLYVTTRTPTAIAFAARDWVVVGDLKNLTGEKVFDDSLQTAFRIGLEQSRYVNVVPELQVRDALKRMERDPASHVDRAVGSEIAQREGARALILPTISEIGGRVRVTAEVVDPKSQTTVYSDSVDGKDESSVLPSLDDLLKKMRARLGESLASIGETSAPLADVTTRNLDALKAYSLGIQAFAEGKATEGIALFNRATELDPEFALAYLYLVNVYYSTGQRAKAHDNVLIATRHLERLSERERLIALGYAAFFENPAALRERWSMFIKIYPDVPDGRQALALGLWWFDNDLREAADHFAKVAVSRRPQRGVSYLFLGDIQLALGDVEAARASYASARQIGAAQVYLDPMNLTIATRDFAGADEALRKEDTHHFAFFEVEHDLVAAAVDVSRGRLANARASAQRAAHRADDAKLVPSRQRARLADLAIALALDDANAKRDLATYVGEEIERTKAIGETYDLSSITHLSHAAMLALRHGARPVAERALAAVKPRAETMGYFSLEQPYRVASCELLVEREPRKAVECLEPLVGERAYYETRVALLRAYLGAGDDEKALATATWLADHRGMATAEWLGDFSGRMPNLLASDEALFEAARIEKKLGRDDASAAHAKTLADAWAGGDTQAPLARRLRTLTPASGAESEKR